jgi:hypothetical protein
MYDVKNLKNKRSQGAAKSKNTIVATVDHKSGNNNKWPDKRERARRRITTARSKPRGLDMTKVETTKIVRKMRRARRKILMHA